MKLFATERATFPDPRHAMQEGIVDVGDDVRVERLLEAYSFGIFPWPHPDFPTLWFCPEKRGILEFADLHIPRSLVKAVNKSGYQYTFNKNFGAVMDACARVPRPHQSGTWITPKLAKAYRDFHKAGYAHSLEVWDGPTLAGGLYGVYVAGVFCGESMFYVQPNASKMALVRLLEFLSANGCTWMDIQMVTPVLKAFGGKYIAREKYLQRLEDAKVGAKFLEFKI